MWAVAVADAQWELSEVGDLARVVVNKETANGNCIVVIKYQDRLLMSPAGSCRYDGSAAGSQRQRVETRWKNQEMYWAFELDEVTCKYLRNCSIANILESYNLKHVRKTHLDPDIESWQRSEQSISCKNDRKSVKPGGLDFENTVVKRKSVKIIQRVQETVDSVTRRLLAEDHTVHPSGTAQRHTLGQWVCS